MSNRMNQILNDYTITKDGRIYDKEGVEIDTFINSCGYVSAELNGYIVTVAYIVAKLYVDNPNNSICIAYKDNDYTNIKADNLKWYYEGEENIEDKSVIVVNEDGNITGYYNTVKDCANDYGCENQTIIAKCNGRITISEDYYFFFDDSFDKEDLKRRIEEKEKRLLEKEKRESVRQQYRLEKWVSSCKRSNSLEVIEFNNNGEIVAEYSSISKFMERYNICYLTADKILKRTGTFNNNYILYRKNFETISDIKQYIQRIDEINKRAEEEKERKRLEALNKKQQSQLNRINRKEKQPKKKKIYQKRINRGTKAKTIRKTNINCRA